MKDEELRSEVSRLLAKTSGRREPIGDDDDLFTSGILDSYTIVNFVMALEERFNITFGFQDIKEAKLQTLKTVVQLLKTTYNL